MKQQKLLVRPVQVNDLRPLCDIASKVGAALPSLPEDEATLRKKIQRSLDSFAQKNAISARLFFFVLEDVEEKNIIATSAIEVQAGYTSPFYSYAVEPLIQKYRSLENTERIQRELHHNILYLSNHYQTASLLCTLYVDPRYRSLGQGSLMSRIRYLFIAEFPQFFSECFIAEMRGVFDANNQFPFWQGLGERFYQMDLLQAEKLLAMEGSQFIADLNPGLPIYVDLLPTAAQQVVAEVHINTKPALHMLQTEGFCYRNHIDVFDGGPIVEVQKTDIKTIQKSRTAVVSGAKNSRSKDPSMDANPIYMVCNAKLDFRATLAPIEWHLEDEVSLEQETLQLLELSLKDKIRLVAFR